MSDREIDENLDVIEEYYDKNLLFDVLKALGKDIGPKPDNERLQYDYRLCQREFWVIAGRIKAADAVRDAKENAEKYTFEVYGSTGTGDKTDAFRHAIWSALIAKYYAQKVRDRDDGIRLAEDFTNAHESCNSDEGNPGYDIEMDLHNNTTGRRYIYSVTTIKRNRGIFKRDEIITPSDEIIKFAIKAKTDNALKVSQSVSVIKSIDPDRLIYYK